MKALFFMTWRFLRCPASMNFQGQENRGNRWATTQISMQDPDKCKQIKHRTRKRKARDKYDGWSLRACMSTDASPCSCRCRRSRISGPAS